MTDKRFENRLDKSNIKFNVLNPVWDYEKEDGLNVFEMIDLLNEQHETIQTLIKENEQLKKENKQLKQELKDCSGKAKEEIRKQREENAIRWANIGW